MVRVENFLSIFAKNGQSNLVLVLVLVLESKGPYLHNRGYVVIIPSCYISVLKCLRGTLQLDWLARI